MRSVSSVVNLDFLRSIRAGVTAVSRHGGRTRNPTALGVFLLRKCGRGGWDSAENASHAAASDHQLIDLLHETSARTGLSRCADCSGRSIDFPRLPNTAGEVKHGVILAGIVVLDLPGRKRVARVRVPHSLAQELSCKIRSPSVLADPRDNHERQ